MSPTAAAAIVARYLTDIHDVMIARRLVERLFRSAGGWDEVDESGPLARAVKLAIAERYSLPDCAMTGRSRAPLGSYYEAGTWRCRDHGAIARVPAFT